MSWMIWSPLEIAANLMTAICIFLAGRGSIHTWWTGLVGCTLFGVMFYNVQLYADATLQIFFFLTGIIGWMQWKGASTHDLTAEWGDYVPITNASNRYMVFGGLIAVVTAAVYGGLLYSMTDAYAPWIDSAVLTLSVLGQLLLMRKNIQTWKVWVLVNTLSVPLFWSRELYLTSVLYGFFLLNAAYSLVHWSKLMKAQKAE